MIHPTGNVHPACERAVRRQVGAEPRGVVDLGRLVWQARSEASRLHRLAVESARHQAQLDQAATEQNERIYRCPGCGDWRYQGCRNHGSGAGATCTTCGHRDRTTQEASA